MLKLHRREHRNNKTDRKSFFRIDIPLSFSILFSRLEFLLISANSIIEINNKLGIFPYEILTLQNYSKISLVRFKESKGVQAILFIRRHCWEKNRKYPPNYSTSRTKAITVARLHRYFLLPVTRRFNILDYWGSVENWSGSGWISMERFRT